MILFWPYQFQKRDPSGNLTGRNTPSDSLRMTCGWGDPSLNLTGRFSPSNSLWMRNECGGVGQVSIPDLLNFFTAARGYLSCPNFLFRFNNAKALLSMRLSGNTYAARKEHRMKRPTLAGLSMLFFALACSLGNSAIETPTPDIDLMGTAVSETLTAMPTSEGEAPEASTPTLVAPQATSTETPEAQGFLPAGVMGWMPGGMVTIYDPQAQPIADYALPDLTFPEPSFIHYAGPFGPGATDGALVYFSLEGGEALKVLDGGNSNVYTAAPGLIAMVGAPAQPVIAYSLFVTPQSGYDTSSELYVGTLDASPVEPILTITNEEGYALYPLGVEAVDGQPVGVWYTTQLWDFHRIDPGSPIRCMVPTWLPTACSGSQ